MTEFGGRLRSCRRKRGLTQRQLAKQLNIPQSAVSEYERGKGMPSLSSLVRLAAALHTSADYLLGLTEDPDPAPFSAAMPSQEAERLQIFCSLPPQKRERAIGILIGLREGGNIL